MIRSQSLGAVAIKKVIIALFLLSFSRTVLCLYSVRDVGFSDIWSSPYQLYYFVQDDTPEEYISNIKNISHSILPESNVIFKIINIDKDKDAPALEHFHFWGVESLPSAILVSPYGQSLMLPLSSTQRPFGESAWPAIEGVISSPVRTEMLKHLVEHYAVIVLIEGSDPGQNERAREEIHAASDEIKRLMPQMVKSIDGPPHTIVLSEESVAREKVLLWSLGVDRPAMGETHAAVFYGRGRRFGPTMKGDKITRRNIFNLLYIIGLSCECGLDRQQLLGVMVPLGWGPEIQSEVVRRLGFDAESPAVKLEMRQILSSGSGRDIWGGSTARLASGSFEEYDEVVLELAKMPGGSTMSPAQLSRLAGYGQTPGSAFSITLVILEIVALIVILGGIIVLWRARMRAT